MIDCAKSPCLLKQPLTAKTSGKLNPAHDQSFASKGVAEFGFLFITSPPFPCPLEKSLKINSLRLTVAGDGEFMLYACGVAPPLALRYCTPEFKTPHQEGHGQRRKLKDGK